VLREPSTFLISAGILSAVLLVWGQIWVQLWVQLWAQPEMEPKIPETALLLGMAWTYISVFFALSAIAWALCFDMRNPEREIGTISLALFITAILMGVINVGQSVISSLMRLWSQKSLAGSVLGARTVEDCGVSWTVAMGAIILFIELGSFHIARSIQGRGAGTVNGLDHPQT
jgi:hypothetical protein